MNRQTIIVGGITVSIAIILGAGLGYWLADRQPAAEAIAASAGAKDPEPLYYRRPMNPEVTSPVPAKNPMGMDYIPVYAKNEQVSGPPETVQIDPVTLQSIGVRTAEAERRSLIRAIRTVGRVDYEEQRLQVVVPLPLLLIFLLLYFNFRNVSAPLVVLRSIPFALIGGIWIVFWYGFNLSVAVAVGFIATAGLAAEIRVLVLTFINQEVKRARQRKLANQPGQESKTTPSDAGFANGPGPENGADLDSVRLSNEEIISAVETGSAERVRPIPMTATAVIAGLPPIMLTSGTGSAVMQRIAAPMMGVAC